jgi:chromosome condensin MukBEF ATPase and DNA-binding subunit MukB
MGSKQERQAAIEQANALVQQSQEPSTTDIGNTDNQQISQQPQGTPDNSDSEQLWEAKYKVLQGKYNSETKRLKERITELEGQLKNAGQDSNLVAQYTNEIESLKREVSELKASPSQSSTDNMSDSEHYAFLVDEYGPELANAITNMIKANKSPGGEDLTQLKQQVGELSQHNAQQQQQMRVDTITSILKQKGIDFMQLDNDPLFMSWLDEDEGRSGMPRIQFLRQHFTNGNIAKAADFYIEFTAQQRSQLQGNPLANNLSANESADGDFNSADSESFWTGEEIDRLYSDRRKGLISDQDFKRYEQDLNLAAAQGRVRN